MGPAYLTYCRGACPVADAHVRAVREDGQLIGELTLDPRREYQPLRRRTPVQNVLRQVSSMSCDITRSGRRDSNPPSAPSLRSHPPRPRRRARPIAPGGVKHRLRGRRLR